MLVMLCCCSRIDDTTTLDLLTVQPMGALGPKHWRFCSTQAVSSTEESSSPELRGVEKLERLEGVVLSNFVAR